MLSADGVSINRNYRGKKVQLCGYFGLVACGSLVFPLKNMDYFMIFETFSTDSKTFELTFATMMVLEFLGL